MKKESGKQIFYGKCGMKIIQGKSKKGIPLWEMFDMEGNSMDWNFILDLLVVRNNDYFPDLMQKIENSYKPGALIGCDRFGREYIAHKELLEDSDRYPKKRTLQLVYGENGFGFTSVDINDLLQAKKTTGFWEIISPGAYDRCVRRN